MASYIGGYAQDRFQTSVDKNFFCPICTDVLKDPVQCHNQRYFCKACITKHLKKNSQTCPVCMQKLTEEELARPPRIVTDYLDGLIINCDHSEWGCTETMELGALNTHAAICAYRPVVCSNDQCSVIVNMKDLEEHETKHCEYRLIHCHECNENISVKRYGKHACLLRKEVDQMKVLLFDIKNRVTKMQETQDRKFEEVLAGIQKLSPTSQFVTNKATPAVPPSSTQENIVVLGGMSNGKSLNSVEMYSSLTQSWTQLAPMTECRASATAHCYEDQIIVTGGGNDWQSTDSTETMFLGMMPEQWYSCPFELPEKCLSHRTVIHNDYLWTVGGTIDDHTSCCSKAISKVFLQPPFTMMLEAEMPQPLCYHGLEIIGDNFMIIGGSTSGSIKDAVSTVLSYNIVSKKIVQMSPLPFPMLDMTTVRIGEYVLIIGGTNQQRRSLNTVYKYNCKTMQCTQLPSMKYKRSECAAVVSGHQVFVMGGDIIDGGYHNSVECFDLRHQVWDELPPMNEAKNKLTTVCVPARFF